MSEHKGSYDTALQAFPAVCNEGWSMYQPGMSLRTYLAAKAMQGMCSIDPKHGLSSATITDWAFDQADSMIARIREDEKKESGFQKLAEFLQGQIVKLKAMTRMDVEMNTFEDGVCEDITTDGRYVRFADLEAILKEQP